MITEKLNISIIRALKLARHNSDASYVSVPTQVYIYTSEEICIKVVHKYQRELGRNIGAACAKLKTASREASVK